MPLKSFNSIRISNYAESPHSQTPVRAFIMPLLFDLIPPSLGDFFLKSHLHDCQKMRRKCQTNVKSDFSAKNQKQKALEKVRKMAFSCAFCVELEMGLEPTTY